jgi:hypothetical protein
VYSPLHAAAPEFGSRVSFAEATHLLSRRLALGKALSDTPAGVQQELDILLELGHVLRPSKGLATPEVEAMYHPLLTPIYGWFTAGFDTADLQEARALLEALGE